ncbi:transcriptional activator RfaH [Salinivibrio sp. MA351]|uniref:transcription/translation regulatory transformer protein RfaH n=1 Tax=Salinivibrio TaxID=51366 RepID=UPI00098924DE|nr:MULTISPECIES: transcription/translation regulatory transformer protein RfaH [unclassified Salinivibrio]NUY56348.1 transcription/translation regulatory transformer protein RfaH [Salinivibrio sp. EAGSL]OOE99163.1 transcriptional activator RfaH [Salinivibrio sp. IB643]OOF00006.1 transcriptional activator RfaH [Salinivibrio sp. MA351]OOF06442.1 transcriptional activator RfaH [Salinivibrio sp. MA607]
MKHWYLLYCKRTEQQRAEQNLKRQGVDCYYPIVTVEKLRRGKYRQVEEPLFPNYIFACFDPESVQYTSVRSTRGVVDFVRQGAKPIHVDIQLIQHLMMMEDSDEQRELLYQGFKPGQKVTVESGQFAGAEAIFKEKDGEKRCILLIKILNQQTELRINNSDIKASC